MPSVRAKTWLKNLLRVAVSLGILAYILAHIPLRDHRWTVVGREGDKAKLRDAGGAERTIPLKRFDAPVGGEWVERGFLSAVRDIRLGWALAALAAFGLAPALQALRWRGLLHVQDVRLSVPVVLKLMWIGLFFNLFLLGAVGGDLVKAYYVSKHTHSRAESMVTVLIDRIIGLLGLVWLSGLSMVAWLLWRPAGGEIEGGLPWAWLIPGLVVLLGAATFYNRPMRRAFGLDWLLARLREDHVVRRLDRAVFLYRHHKATIASAFGWTFLSHVCLMLTVYFSLRAFSMPADVVGRVLVCGPLIFVASGLIPSIGGLGIQEYGFVLFFAPLIAAGDGVALALAASLLFRLVTVAWSLPGAGLLMVGAHLPSRAQMKQELRESAE